jgi:hypothetical protein
MANAHAGIRGADADADGEADRLALQSSGTAAGISHPQV